MEYCILLYGHMRKRFVATGTYIHNWFTNIMSEIHCVRYVSKN
jgi:hypothetical protein